MMTEDKLLERLIEEAARRGSIEHQRDDAVVAMEKAGISAANNAEALHQLGVNHSALESAVRDLRVQLNNTRKEQEDTENFLRQLVNAAGEISSKKTRASFREALAKADKYLDVKIPF